MATEDRARLRAAMTSDAPSAATEQTQRRSRIACLPDGRRLGYAEWGAADGWPLLFFHGTPSSRLGLDFAEPSATAAGARLLSIDRPGHGLSDFAPGRTLLDWPRDVDAFADVLGLDRFAVSGWSGGGPYVLACAVALPDRVTGAGVLSGCGPLDTAELRRGTNSLDRVMLATSGRAPWLARVLLRPVVNVSRRAPHLAVKSLEKDLSARDLEAFERFTPEHDRAMQFFLEAFRTGTRGVVDDYRVLAEPWDFEPESIRIPVHFWHGDADRMAAAADAKAVADRIPEATFTLFPGEGHMLLVDHIAEVVATLAP